MNPIMLTSLLCIIFPFAECLADVPLENTQIDATDSALPGVEAQKKTKIGPRGPRGHRGHRGYTGDPGPAGATGATGAIGQNGATGWKGTTGPTGAAGFLGPTGSAGTAGPTGNNGQTGATGITGATGATGDIGTIGATGATGATGAALAFGAAYVINSSALTPYPDEANLPLIIPFNSTDPSGSIPYDSSHYTFILGATGTTSTYLLEYSAQVSCTSSAQNTQIRSFVLTPYFVPNTNVVYPPHTTVIMPGEITTLGVVPTLGGSSPTPPYSYATASNSLTVTVNGPTTVNLSTEISAGATGGTYYYGVNGYDEPVYLYISQLE